MVGWHHQLNGHEFEQALGVGDGQGGLACCDSWGRRESDTTEQVNGTELREGSAVEGCQQRDRALSHSRCETVTLAAMLTADCRGTEMKPEAGWDSA